MKKGLVHWFIILTFVSLYLIVSVISTIHVVEFFRLSNPEWLSISLAIAFEVGAAASLASIIVLDKMNKFLVWALFMTLTFMQAMGNTYYAFTHLSDFQSWIELFGLVEEEIIYQKRILSLISGAILPLVALGFIKSLVDYIKPSEEVKESNHNSLDVKDKTIEDIGNVGLSYSISGSENSYIREDTSLAESEKKEFNPDSDLNLDSETKNDILQESSALVDNVIQNQPQIQVGSIQDPVLRHRMELQNNR